MFDVAFLQTLSVAVAEAQKSAKYGGKFKKLQIAAHGVRSD